MTADKQLKAYIDRVLRLKEEQDTLGDDIREIYAEAKAEGYDKTVMGKLVAHLRKVAKSGADAVDEAECIFDTYLQAYHRASGTAVATHTHEEEFDPITGEFVRDEKPAMALRSPRQAAGAVSERTAIDQPGTANETPKQVYGDSVEDATAPPSQSVEIPAGGDQGQKIDGSDDRCPAESHSPEQAIPSDDDAIAAVKGRARLANVADVEPPSSAPIAPASQGEAEAPSAECVSLDEGSSAAANTGGDHVEREPSAATHQAGALVEPAPATPGDVTYEDFPPVPMKRTSFAHCFPELSAREYDALGTSIAFEGVLEPIVRRGNILLDGWSRYNIARNLGIQYPVVEYEGSDQLLDVIRWQRAARNFTAAQSKKIAAELAKEVPHRASDIMAAFELEMEEA